MGVEMKKENRQEYLWALFAKNTFNHDNQIAQVKECFPNTEFQSLLELGCGAGMFLGEVDTLGYKCTGVDINKDRISLAKILNRNRKGNCKFYPYKAEDFKNEGESDGVFWMNVPLDFDTITTEFIECAYRCLRPKGRILFDYLIYNGNQINSHKGIWSDNLFNENDHIIPSGTYQRNVILDYTKVPWQVSWEISPCDHKNEELSFCYDYEVPIIDNNDLRQKIEDKGWNYLREIDCGKIVLDGRSSGFSYKTDLFEKI